MSYVLQKKWTPHHPDRGWEWVLNAVDTENHETEAAAIIYTNDRDGPFNLVIWDWVDQEYSEIENLPTLKAAKAMGRLLASIETAKEANF
jgi:hypothetical protein